VLSQELDLGDDCVVADERDSVEGGDHDLRLGIRESAQERGECVRVLQRLAEGLLTSPSAEPTAYVWTSPGIGPDPLGKCPLEWKGRVNRSPALSVRQTYFRPGSRLLDHEQALAGRSDDVLTGVTGYHDACVGTRFTEAPRCQVVMPLVSGGKNSGPSGGLPVGGTDP